MALQAWAAKLMAFSVSFVMSLVFGLLPLGFEKVEPKLRDRVLGLANCFAGGAFLAGGFLDLLKESIEFFNEEYEDSPIPVALILSAAGLLAAFFVEKVIFLKKPKMTVMEHFAEDEDCENVRNTPGLNIGVLNSCTNESCQGDRNVDLAYDAVLVDMEEGISISMDHNDHHHHADAHSIPQREGKDNVAVKTPVLPHYGTVDPVNAQTIEKIEKKKEGHGEEEHGHHEHLVAIATGGGITRYLLVFILSLHSFVTGMALGIQEDTDQVIVLFIAIVGHKWIESFALGVSILRSEDVQVIDLVKGISIYSVTLPTGILFGSILQLVLTGEAGDYASSCLTSFASGTFIYVAVIDIMAEEFSQTRYHDKYLKFILLLIGFLALGTMITVFAE